MTNGDKIRSMSDEEMANEISKGGIYCECCPAQEGLRVCNRIPDTEGCREAFMAWLKEEAESCPFCGRGEGKPPTWKKGKAFCGNCGGCLENKEMFSSYHVQSIRFCKWCGAPVNWSNE